MPQDIDPPSQDIEPSLQDADPPSQKSSRKSNIKIMKQFFWGTIILLFCTAVSLPLIGWLHTTGVTKSESNKPLELPSTFFETALTKVAKEAADKAGAEIEPTLDQVYAPIYKAIPEYAEFHYSVLGEYAVLASAALGKMSDTLYHRLYPGFDRRFIDAAKKLDQKYSEAYNEALSLLVSDEKKSRPPLPLGPITKTILQDAKDRAKITVPIATVAATATTSGALKALIASVAAKLAAKITAKAVAKGVLKGTGMLTGALTGAIACSWSGPFAAVCGGGAALVIWFLTDAAIVNLDEYFHRDEFEAELRDIINEDRVAKKKLLVDALNKKAHANVEASAKAVTPRELNEQNR